MKKTLVAVLLLLLAAACAQFPVTDEVKIAFSKDDPTAVVTAETTFPVEPRSDEMRKRIELARAAAQSNTDAWALRFSRLNAEEERVTYATKRGVLQSVTRSATIPDDEIQQLFSDSSITVSVVHGDGWRELRFYPGTSTRATREQQRQFAGELASWSALVARYFAAVHRLYAYMNENPGRAKFLFAALMREKGEDGAEPTVPDVEQPLVDDVANAMDDVAMRMDEQEGRAATFAEMADLVFNPFPARVTVSVPGHIYATEGFASEQDLTIEPVSLFETIATLEGKWIAPDPLAALLQERQMTAEELAKTPRKSTAVVSATSISDAIREQLARPKAYVVRFRD